MRYNELDPEIPRGLILSGKKFEYRLLHPETFEEVHEYLCKSHDLLLLNAYKPSSSRVADAHLPP